MKNLSILILVILTISFVACKQTTAPQNTNSNKNEELIQISHEQFKSEKMEIGIAEMHNFEDIVSCNGFIMATPNGIARLSTPFPGIVKSIHFTPGDFVKKSQILCKITSNELITLQQEFAETAALQESIAANYKRSKTLYKENIGSEKELLIAESTYKANKAKYESLALKLQLLHFNIDKIKEGYFYSSFSMLAPINGYITSSNLVLGEFTDQQKSFVELINPNELQMHIAVFEKDIYQLKIGQKVLFKSLSKPDEIFTAQINSIGKGIDPETKSIICRAKIEEKAQKTLYNGSFIEAEIITHQKDAKAIPTESILKSGPDHYVFVLAKSDEKNYYLRKEKIRIGSESKGFSELLDSQKLDKVLIHGVYKLSTY
ncbi:efflux RND transporter periplasmic adaptor subunit [Labilibaculum sp.]|uniref:efflux RND transporter periplasmic adaptor subunit n=1 Tax=Labilibaculum sp. TaxID=2060723 RepID=UPI003568E793